MKFMIILLLLVSIVILIGLFIMSARLLKHAKQQDENATHQALNPKSKQRQK
ncbi:hypothetical protein SAMN05421749_101679 [Acinetobacter marinus]|uniref:Uncharacterized protein n=1 Tax=Acinetobacter marinus TaxID=281375 RepID=A0A1G6H275_9GAMM|nr:hypothetical protein [Acinetobacter marinus]SDB88397.1 hypothetical protein SAMN05421749_101679 [Acinetobacter marinus]